MYAEAETFTLKQNTLHPEEAGAGVALVGSPALLKCKTLFAQEDKGPTSRIQLTKEHLDWEDGEVKSKNLRAQRLHLAGICHVTQDKSFPSLNGYSKDL